MSYLKIFLLILWAFVPKSLNGILSTGGSFIMLVAICKLYFSGDGATLYLSTAIEATLYMLASIAIHLSVIGACLISDSEIYRRKQNDP